MKHLHMMCVGTEQPAGADSSFYLMVYALLGLSVGLAAAARSGIFSWRGFIAGRSMHVTLLSGISSACNTFFDETPSGRILNRFSSDIAAIDTTVPGLMGALTGVVLDAVGALGVIAYSTPMFLVAVVFLQGAELHLKAVDVGLSPSP